MDDEREREEEARQEIARQWDEAGMRLPTPEETRERARLLSDPEAARRALRARETTRQTERKRELEPERAREGLYRDKLSAFIAELELLEQLEADGYEVEADPAALERGTGPSIPIDGIPFKRIANLFKRKLTCQDETKAAEEAVRRYEKEAAGGQLSFVFPALPDETKAPAIGPWTLHFLFALWELTAETGSGEWYAGTATVGEILGRLGAHSPGGADCEQVERMLRALSVHVTFDNKRRGKKRVRWGFNGFVMQWKIVGEGTKARVVWMLNPSSVSTSTLLWILGQLDEEAFRRTVEEVGFIVPFPKAYLREPLQPHADNARTALLTHKGWPKGKPPRVSAYTFARDWMGVNKHDLERRPDPTARKVFATLSELKAAHVISGYDPAVPDKKKYTSDDLKRLRFQLKPPRLKFPPGGPEVRDQFLTVLRWLLEKQHGTRKSPSEREKSLLLAHGIHGSASVWDTYLNHGPDGTDSPALFWEELKEKSRRKSRKAAPRG